MALSTTAKSKARIARKRAKEDGEPGDSEGAAMDVDKKEEEGTDEKKVKSESMDVDSEDAKPAADEIKPRKKREPEPTSFRITNPARITTAQANVCAFDLNQRYRPIRPEVKPYGVIMLTDSTPGEDEEDLGAVKTPAQEDEADPPQAFEWTPPGHVDHPDTTVGKTDSTAAATDKDDTQPEAKSE